MQVTTVRSSHLIGAIAAIGLGAALLLWAPWSTQARGAAAVQASNVAMNCAPGQQAIVQQHVANGELNVSVNCAGQANGVTPAAYQTNMEAPYVPQNTVAVPAVYRTSYPSAPRAYAPRASSAPRPVRRTVESRRDWKKEALIIGGSAGAGAGIGGLISGKKGALIGAALGGGGAALYRAAKQ